MGFWSEFSDMAQKPFVFAYNQAGRVVNLGDKVLDAAGHVATGTGGLADGLSSLLAGNSNVLLYAGIGIVAVVILPIVLQKVL